MEKKTVRTIWGIYGIIAIAGTVASYVWARKQWKQMIETTEYVDLDEETE